MRPALPTLLPLLVLACAPKGGSTLATDDTGVQDSGDADADTDADADSDADSDTDGDADTDAEPNPWAGEYAGAVGLIDAQFGQPICDGDIAMTVDRHGALTSTGACEMGMGGGGMMMAVTTDLSGEVSADGDATGDVHMAADDPRFPTADATFAGTFRSEGTHLEWEFEIAMDPNHVAAFVGVADFR